MNLVHKGLVTRFCFVILTCLAGLTALTVACGRERRESGAAVVPVQGLTYGSFSLVGENDRCVSLVQFVTQFSAQYAPGVYRDVDCKSDEGTKRNTLTFTVRDSQNQDATVATGRAIQVAGIKPAFVLCQVPQGNDAAGTSCSGVQADASADGVPGRFREAAYRLHDLYYSLGDFILR
jgi:hypothetical protein